MSVFLALLLVGGPGPVRISFTPQPAENQGVIELRTRTVDVSGASLLSVENPDVPTRFLVHFDHRLSSADRELLIMHGLKVEGYVSQGGFCVYGEPGIAAGLLAAGEIDWYGEYQAEDRVDPALWQGNVDSWDGQRMEIMLFEGMDAGKVEARLASLGVEVIQTSENEYNGKLLVRMGLEDIVDAASIGGVRWIEPYCELQWDNDRGQWVVQTWQDNNRRVWDMGLRGDGVIGSTSDSGINTLHVMFSDSSVFVNGWGDYPDHRKIVAYQAGAPGAGFGDEASAGYHGSHTAGTVCGDDSYWGENSPYDGMAPGARLYFVDLQGGFNWSVPLDYRDLWRLPQEGNQAGQASFISNSWSIGSGYNSHAWESDHFSWEHPDFLLIGTAGNNNNYIGAPKTAKSFLTVGATMNGPAANLAAGFSNPGPTPDGRIKPTVVAPGQDVKSADGSGTDGYRSYDGTSMACPMVAGATALLVEYLRKGWYPTGAPDGGDSLEPSSALLRAMLINSTIADFVARPVPDRKVGWGRIALDSVLYFAGDERKLYLDDERDGLETGDAVSYEIGLQGSSATLRVSLVWTDPPPEMTASRQIVNNLDLVVIDPQGNVYYGNNLDDNYSEAGGNPDNLNVEEIVRVKKPAQGSWSIRVKGTEIPQGPQPYAIVVTGDMEFHDVDLVSAGMWFDDATSANPSGGLDPGEELVFHPVVANNGTYPATGVWGILTADDEDISILEEETSFGDIQPGNTVDGSGFRIRASSTLEKGQQVTFFLALDANQGAYASTLAYPVTLGLSLEEDLDESPLWLEVSESPFQNHIGIRFQLPTSGKVEIDMFDKTGRRVRTFLDEAGHSQGEHYYTFSATDDYGHSLASGVYFIRLRTEGAELYCRGLRLR